MQAKSTVGVRSRSAHPAGTSWPRTRGNRYHATGETSRLRGAELFLAKCRSRWGGALATGRGQHIGLRQTRVRAARARPPRCEAAPPSHEKPTWLAECRVQIRGPGGGSKHHEGLCYCSVT
jgi:hypothetical protein